MATSVRIEHRGIREVHAILEGVARRTDDASPALRQVARWVRGEWGEAFSTGGRNLPKPWRPLTASTREAKQRRGYDPHILVRRGDLRDSLTRQHHPSHTQTITPGELRIGTKSRVTPLLRHHGRDPVQPPRDMGPAVRIIERWAMDGQV